jgi:hypothetical protein
MSLNLQLTPLDRRILEVLPLAADCEVAGIRAERVAKLVVRSQWPRVETTDAERHEVLEILRGLECFGLAMNDNGWWRRA